MKIRVLAILSLFLILFRLDSGAQLYSITSGKIIFDSNAPQEDIHAESIMLNGLMDSEQNTFAFSVEIKSFKGFNSALQQEHFYENYMQTDKYPTSTFAGKLIDKFNPQAVKQKVRAKGQLEIHGVKKERIIEVELTKTANGFKISSDFNVLLADHGIVVPKIVFQKIAENINVKVSGVMAMK